LAQAIFGWHLRSPAGIPASALAAGCPVVVKVHPAMHVPRLLDGMREAPDS